MTDVPVVHNIYAYIVMFLNCIVPGTGTILAACIADRYAANKTQLILGMFQFMTAPFIFGWIWSIYWGVLII